MIRCYITDRHKLGGVERLLDNIARQIESGVEWIQLREKDLPDSELLHLAWRSVDLANGRATRILVNSRLDIALAAGAHGVHLPAGSLAPSEWRRVAPGMIIGVSCHNSAQLRAAAQEGAGYALLSPVWTPRSKTINGGEALGLARFADMVRGVNIPVLALGGITPENSEACIRAGAAGVAGISLFQAI